MLPIKVESNAPVSPETVNEFEFVWDHSMAQYPCAILTHTP